MSNYGERKKCVVTSQKFVLVVVLQWKFLTKLMRILARKKDQLINALGIKHLNGGKGIYVGAENYHI